MFTSTYNRIFVIELKSTHYPCEQLVTFSLLGTGQKVLRGVGGGGWKGVGRSRDGVGHQFLNPW